MTKKIFEAAAAIIITMILFSIPLHWAGSILHVLQLEAEYNYHYQQVEIPPSGLFDTAIENNANVVVKSRVFAGKSGLDSSFGIDDYFILGQYGLTDFRMRDFVNWWHLKGEGRKFVIFNVKTGLIELRNIAKKQSDKGWQEKVVLYAGPKGISTKPEPKLGSFYRPVIADFDGETIICFDENQRRFFKIDIGVKKDEKEQIDLNNCKVTAGEELKDGFISPVQISSRPFKGYIRFDFQPPQISLEKGQEHGSAGNKHSVGQTKDVVAWSAYLQDKKLVVNKEGVIDLLDVQTLKIEKKNIGRLPQAPTFLTANNEALPGKLLSYQIMPIVIDGQYNGLAAASVSRDETGIAAAIFDKDGKCIETKVSNADIKAKSDSYTAMPVYMQMAGGSTWLIAKYLIENLYPVTVSAASFIFADSCEAIKGYNNLFILPGSYAAMIAREPEEYFYYNILKGLFLISPSIVFSIVLVLITAKDSRKIGLPAQEKLWWIIGVFLFGLAGYIAYKITRPKETLVTCKNCGMMRRPDMQTCHNCKADWEMPQLVEPQWRVYN